MRVKIITGNNIKNIVPIVLVAEYLKAISEITTVKKAKLNNTILILL